MEKGRAEYLLGLIPDDELRQLAEGEGVTTSGRSKDSVINALYLATDDDSKWTEIQDTAERFDRESDPISCCIFELNSTTTTSGTTQRIPDISDLNREFEARSADFDNDGEVCGSGFDMDEIDNSWIEGCFFNYSSGYDFNAQRRVYSKTNLIKSDFEIDVDSDLIRVYNPHPSQANGVRGRLEEMGLSFSNIGHYNRLPSDANDLMDEFASELNDSVEDYGNLQLDSGLEVRNAVVDRVKLDIDGERLTDANLSGSDDILDESGLRRFFLDEYDEDVVMAQIGGTFPYENNTSFRFRVGYTRIPGANVSQIKVRKRGDRTGDVDIVRDAHEFLLDLYIEHFAN